MFILSARFVHHVKGYKMDHEVRYRVCCAQGLKNEVELSYFEPDE